MAVHNVSVQQLLPGMIVAEDVYNSSQFKVLIKNTVISPKSISKLKVYGIRDIIVFIPTSLVNKIPTVKESTTNKVKDSLGFKKFKKYYLESVDQIKSTFLKMSTSSNKELDPKQFMMHIDSLFQECGNSMRSFELLHCMRDFDDLTYVHSLNVGLICYSFGTWLHYSQKDLMNLTIAGVLHDIGKTKIPPSIIYKPTKLTEDEFNIVRKHPQYGYDIVKDITMDEHIKSAILMHHERSDGSGYPLGLKNSQIDPMAKIVAIADVYDAMTASRVYRDSICPFDVLETIETDGYEKYDPEFLTPFLEQVAQSYIGTSVLLSNSLVGEVVMINKAKLSKPVVKVEKEFFDLSKIKDIRIKSIV